VTKLGIEGIQEAQADNARKIAALKPRGAYGRFIKDVVTALHRYAVTITHVWHYKGGGLRASHRMKLEPSKLYGEIYIDPKSVNPRGQKPSVYGPYEEKRGGTHAFYNRTVKEAGDKVVRKAWKTHMDGAVR
jgi:hypothetical protein